MGFSSGFCAGLTSVFGFLAEVGFLGVDLVSALAGVLDFTGVLDLAAAGFAGALAGFFSAVLATFAGFLLLAAGDLLAGGFFCLPNRVLSALTPSFFYDFGSLALAVSLAFLVGFSFDYDGFFFASFSSLAFFYWL